MGRKHNDETLDKYPYISVCRNSGRTSYYRIFLEPHRPHLKGQFVSPKGKLRTVSAHQPSIRVALPKKDWEGAWTQIHDKVEAIVRRAYERSQEVSMRLAAVSAITPTQRWQMLDQVRHSILAADDRLRTRSEEVGEVAQVLDAVLRNGNLPAASVRELQQVAQNIAYRVARSNVKAGKPAIFDSDGEEGGISADARTIDMIQRLGRIAKPSGIKFDPKMKRLLKGRLSQRAVIASDVTALLARNRVMLPKGHEDRLQLALDIPRVQADAYRVVVARRNGATTLTPSKPSLI